MKLYSAKKRNLQARIYQEKNVSNSREINPLISKGIIWAHLCSQTSVTTGKKAMIHIVFALIFDPEQKIGDEKK